MILKKLSMAGVLGVMMMGVVQAAFYQTPILAENPAKVELVNWCIQHPHKCHPHWHPYRYYRYYGHPDNWYHKGYRFWANHCRHHPFSSAQCERFCALNPRVCVR